VKILDDKRKPFSGVHVWLVLWKTTRAVEVRATRSIEALGLCGSDFGVLEAVLHKGPLPVNVLGRKVLLTSGSITTAVDRLEQRGLVERRPDARDRRARVVHLTPEGRKLIRKAFAGHAADMERTVEVLAPRERETLVGLLKKLGRQEEFKEGEQG
jgi:MarR family transcriptional regulator, 2-MHQ and catechol-resistance regulon repressor